MAYGVCPINGTIKRQRYGSEIPAKQQQPEGEGEREPLSRFSDKHRPVEKILANRQVKKQRGVEQKLVHTD